MSLINESDIKEYFNVHASITKKINFSQIEEAANIIFEKVKDQKNIFTMGNGGSAHNASHYITDWSKMSYVSKGLKVRGVCLNDNNGLLTAYSNDISFNDVFKGQLQYLMNSGDLVIVVSGSGNSRNIIEALKYANENGATTMAFLGYDGGESIKISQHYVHVPSFDMQICEDIHLKIGHIIMKFLCSYDVIKD